jgi:sensor histidine kinase regulating citrate/malate metabolism
MDKILNDIINWVKFEKTDNVVFPKNYYKTRNLFQSELNNFLLEAKDSLLTAIVGEIGNNSYDHNLGNWKDVVGIVFAYDFSNKTIILADRGQGIKETLSKVKNDIKTDEQAMNIALNEIISGRASEQRGNGLKFVSKVVKMKNWYLYLQSGNGCIEVSKGAAEFTTKPYYVYGCLAIIKY